MGFFRKSTSELEAEIKRVKKEKALLVEKARLKDVEINKKIAEKEKRDQLVFELKRLRQKPRSKAELLVKRQRVDKAKRIAGKLGGALSRGALDFLQHVDEALTEKPKKKVKPRKKAKKKKRKR